MRINSPFLKPKSRTKQLNHYESEENRKQISRIEYFFWQFKENNSLTIFIKQAKAKQ
jgi:hypothetical protein